MLIVDLKIPTDPAGQRCQGIIDAGKLTSATIGPKLTGMLSSLAETLLSKSVVNEQNLIETPNVNIYAKM
jgi:hypothetical protein